MNKKQHKFPVVEIFGPTIQGEGPDVGQIVSFVRLAFCDFNCPMCDTTYSWHQPKYVMMSAEEIWEMLSDDYSQDGSSPTRVVISGGNPAIQEHLSELFNAVPAYAYGNPRVLWSCETQGSVYNSWLQELYHLVVSPKVKSQEQVQTPLSFEQFLDNFDRTFLKERVTIKVVVFDNVDIQDAFDYFNIGYRNGVSSFYFSIGSEESDTRNTILDRYAEVTKLILQQQIRVSHLDTVGILPQLHTLVWGKVRGV